MFDGVIRTCQVDNQIMFVGKDVATDLNAWSMGCSCSADNYRIPHFWPLNDISDCRMVNFFQRRGAEALSYRVFGSSFQLTFGEAAEITALRRLWFGGRRGLRCNRACSPAWRKSLRALKSTDLGAQRRSCAPAYSRDSVNCNVFVTSKNSEPLPPLRLRVEKIIIEPILCDFTIFILFLFVHSEVMSTFAAE